MLNYSDDALVHYVIVRSDLPQGPQAAQIAHAAGESAISDQPHGTHVVVLQASPEQLAELVHRLARSGIPHAPIIESDPPYQNQIMAVGISPLIERRAIRRFTSHLALLGKGVPLKQVG